MAHLQVLAERDGGFLKRRSRLKVYHTGLETLC